MCKNLDLECQALRFLGMYFISSATVQLTKTGSKLATKIWRFLLAEVLPFAFHTNANGPFMQKENIIVWHVFRFQKK